MGPYCDHCGRRCFEVGPNGVLRRTCNQHHSLTPAEQRDLDAALRRKAVQVGTTDFIDSVSIRAHAQEN